MNEWFLYMNDQKNKWTQDRSILFTSFSCSTSPSLYIVRLPRLLKTAPKVLVETALWSTALGNNQKSPRASSSPDSITGNYKGHRAHSLAGFPFFSQNSIWCLCPINSLAGTSREMARRCFCWLLRTINKKHPFLPRSRPRTFFSTQWKVLHWWSYVTTIGISDQTGKRPSPIFANGWVERIPSNTCYFSSRLLNSSVFESGTRDLEFCSSHPVSQHPLRARHHARYQGYEDDSVVPTLDRKAGRCGSQEGRAQSPRKT